MSLIDSMMTECAVVEAVRTSDGAGGFLPVSYTEGSHFLAAITLDSSMNAKVAEKQGVTSVYTITTKKTVVLDYHNIIKRLSDSHYFRITSDGADKYAPDASSLDIRQVSAEKWEVTNP